MATVIRAFQLDERGNFTVDLIADGMPPQITILESRFPAALLNLINNFKTQLATGIDNHIESQGIKITDARADIVTFRAQVEASTLSPAEKTQVLAMLDSIDQTLT